MLWDWGLLPASAMSDITELQLSPLKTPRGCLTPSSYLSRALCLSTSCITSSPKSSSTRGWYSKMILRKPCRKGIVLCYTHRPRRGLQHGSGVSPHARLRQRCLVSKGCFLPFKTNQHFQQFCIQKTAQPPSLLM